jgi:hypothetical protein
MPCVILCMQMAHAQTRNWRSADGEKSLEGTFIKRDASTVTIRRGDRRELSIPLDKIHPDDRVWLEKNHPLPVEAPPAAVHAVFDKLEFGDTRAEVMEKLKNSKLVKSSLPETLMGRTGLNGVYQTLHQVGGLEASLYFDWCEDGRLQEITLQTSSLTGQSVEEKLKPCWKEFIDILTAMHGKPIHANLHFEVASLDQDGMSATHLWKLEGGGTAMLGAARQGEDYQIAVRFTTEDVKPVIIPP